MRSHLFNIDDIELFLLSFPVYPKNDRITAEVCYDVTLIIENGVLKVHKLRNDLGCLQRLVSVQKKCKQKQDKVTYLHRNKPT